ncbi:MAG: right-handed parallel beta-helix repeat-containing protein [Promethearchaeota archaeon]
MPIIKKKNNENSQINSEKKILSIIGLCLLILPLVSIGFLSTPSSDYSTLNIKSLEINFSPKNSAVHDPIYINGSDWTTCDAVTGSGTFADPYIIADLVIDLNITSGIYIKNSQAYGIIQNCTILSCHNGISISSSSNITLIENTVVTNRDAGIRLYETFGINLTRNTAENNTINGINVFFSPNCSLNQNTASGNLDMGMFLSNSPNCNLTANNVTNNVRSYGVYVAESENCTLIGNNILNNEDIGIFIVLADNSTLKENVISYNLGAGAVISSHNTSVFDNQVIRNKGGSIFNYGTNNDIHDNIIIEWLDASFTASSTTVFIGATVNFTDTSSGGNSTLSYLWDFGDGSTSTEQNSSHFYDTAGNNTVILTVTDSEDISATFTAIITVIEDTQPIASFTVSNTTVFAGDVLNFVDGTTGGNEPLEYLWEFGDGVTSTEYAPTHSYSAVGNYTVSLTVTDIDGDVSTFSLDIVVLSSPDGDSSGGIPGYSFGILFISVLVAAVYLARKRR